MLRNSTELPLVRVVHKEGDKEIRSNVGEYQAETLSSLVGNHPLLIEWRLVGRNQSLHKDIREYRPQVRQPKQEYLDSLTALELPRQDSSIDVESVRSWEGPHGDTGLLWDKQDCPDRL